jgi:hypothetical protein
MFLSQPKPRCSKRSSLSRALTGGVALAALALGPLASATLSCSRPPKPPETVSPQSVTAANSTETDATVNPGSSGAMTELEERSRDDGVPPNPLPAPSRAEAERVWRDFVSAWNSRDPKKTAPWDPSRGLILIDNPGAFTRLRPTAGIGKLAELEGEFDGARVKIVNLDATLEAAEAPSTDCGAEIPDQGNFVAAPERVKLKLRWEALSKYELASVEEIQALEGPVRHATAAAWFTVYDIRQNVGFLFGREGARTVLLAIDAVFPCSA